MRKVGSDVVGTLHSIIYSGGIYKLTRSYDVESFTHKRDYSGDFGGPFFCTTSGYSSFTPMTWDQGGGYGPGQAVPVAGGVDSMPFNVLTNSQMNAKGTTAIARSEPTSPPVSMAQALGELRADGLPRAVGLEARSKHFLGLGDEYLNVEFGWKPFVDDIRGLCHQVRHGHEIMKNYVKHSDSKIKTRYAYPTSKSTVSVQSPIIMSGGYYFGGNGSSSAFSLEEDWFEGAFRYHVPMADGQMNRIGEIRSYADHVLGLRLTPETVWELTPWSWMADWFGNTGDIIHNISAMGHDGLVLQYGYYMSHRRVEAVRSHDLIVDWAPRQVCSSTTFTDSKKRLPANPYGFEAAIESLSGKQLAVIAALGLSKGGRPWTEQK